MLRFLPSLIFLFSFEVFAEDTGVLPLGTQIRVQKTIALDLNQKYYSFQVGRLVEYGSEDQEQPYCTVSQRAGNTSVVVPAQQRMTITRSIRRQIQNVYYDAFTVDSTILGAIICWGANGKVPTRENLKNSFGVYFLISN